MICSQICILSICVHHLVFCCPCPRNWWVYMRCLRWTMAMAAKATTSYFIETMKRKKIIRQLALGQIRAQRQGASMHTQLTGISPTLHRHFTDTSPTLLRNSLKFQKIQENSKKFWKIPKFAKILGNFEQNREIRKIRRNFRNCENFRKFLEISINPGNFPASPPHRHFTDTSPTFHRHFTDISPTLHRHFTDISPTFHRHFTDTFGKFFEISENSRKFRKIRKISGIFKNNRKI